MTTEEKARAYDKAIEKIKYVIEHGVSPTLNKEDLQDLFPELQESEDAKIRRAILDYLTILWGNSQDDICGVNVEDAIAWLEKQGEKPQVDGFDAELNVLLKKYEHLPKEEILECMNFYVDELEKQWRDEI